MRYPVALSLLAVFASACFEKGDTGNEDALYSPCIVTTTVITFEEASALGFSASDAMAAVATPVDADIAWTASGDVTVAHMSVTHDTGEVRYLESVPNPDAGGDSGMELAAFIECVSSIEVDVSVTFATDDGALNESLSGTLSTYDGLDVSVSASQDMGAITGTFTYDIPSDADSAALEYAMAFGASGTSGTIMAFCEGSDDSGEDGVAWASQDPVASWPVVTE